MKTYSSRSNYSNKIPPLLPEHDGTEADCPVNTNPICESPVTPDDMKMIDKLEASAPYNIFFTKAPKAVKTLATYNCISFSDLLCKSLGKLNCSLQINFKIDIKWLLKQYRVHKQQRAPLTILYGYEYPDMQENMSQFQKFTHYLVNNEEKRHNSKVGIFAYKNGDIRIVVSTANLCSEDWNKYNQQLWVSPPCPRMDDSVEDARCAGPTGFKTVLVKYLKSYNTPILTEWISLVTRADFSNVKVCLVTSIPGTHYPRPTAIGCHLHQVGTLLSKHCTLPSETKPESNGTLPESDAPLTESDGPLPETDRPLPESDGPLPDNDGPLLENDGPLPERDGPLPESDGPLPERDGSLPESDGPLAWSVIAQAPNLGFFGKTHDVWLRRYLLRSLASHKQEPLPNRSKAPLRIIYPSADNVTNSYLGAKSGRYLPYFKKVNNQQNWLQDYLHQWKADNSGRSEVMPLMKTYCRISPCLTKLAWFLLTSSNISRGAWGGDLHIKNQGCQVRSYEVGVLFLPSFFEEEYFTISSESGDAKLFPLMYDLPLTPYSKDDAPWCK